MAEPPVTVLIVDDERANRESVEKILEREGYRTRGADHGRGALEICRKERIDVIITDLMMPNMSGIELMRAVRAMNIDAEVLVMTAYGTIETAVEAIKEGAYDFIEKPLKRMPLLRSVRKAVERRALWLENKTLKTQIHSLTQRSIVGSSAALKHALDMVVQVATTSANVLLLGESGTGKELFARTLHDHSGRKGAFVPVHLAALPESIVEAELFGYERGAFTGATERRTGRIAESDGGTLFLDEVGELPASIQVKLLRVLQEGEYQPLGGKVARSSFRLVAATHRNLEDAVQQGQFREDLFYRLNVVAITCPPLRDRPEDIPALVEHFLDLYAAKNQKHKPVLTGKAMDLLKAYPWPGNIRELENTVERSVVLNKGGPIDIADLPVNIQNNKSGGETLSFAVGTTLEEIERRAIEVTLRHAGGDKQLAAQLLGVSTRTIHRRVS